VREGAGLGLDQAVGIGPPLPFQRLVMMPIVRHAVCDYYGTLNKGIADSAHPRTTPHRRRVWSCGLLPAATCRI